MSGRGGGGKLISKVRKEARLCTLSLGLLKEIISIVHDFPQKTLSLAEQVCGRLLCYSGWILCLQLYHFPIVLNITGQHKLQALAGQNQGTSISEHWRKLAYCPWVSRGKLWPSVTCPK
jgi:hypothetical protein